MTLEELQEELRSLNFTLKGLMDRSRFLEFTDLSGVDFNYKDPDMLFIRDELRVAMDKLADAYCTVTFLDKPISYTGVLSRRPDGRYGTEDGFYYTSGSSIEVLIDDPVNGDPPRWVSTTIEFDEDYYLYGFRSIPLEGLQVRRR